MFCIGLLLNTIYVAPSALAEPQVQNAEKVKLIVKMAKGQSMARAQEAMRVPGAIPEALIDKLDLQIIEVPASAADAIAGQLNRDARIIRVETDRIRRSQGVPSDTLYPNQWALPKIAWNQVFGKANTRYYTKLAILDTGVDATHPDLSGVVVPGYSAFTNSIETIDENGHGTWVAGIAAARTDNLLGIAGVAFDHVQVIPVKVLDADGMGRDSDIIRGILWAVDNGASVILMAFSGEGFSDALQDAIDYAWSKDVVVVAAAGNDGRNVSTFPAGNRGVIGVSATDENDALASLSTFGPSVFLAAPGVGITGTYPNNSYVVWSGTSASAAIVAGAAALVRSVDPSLSNGIVVARLAHSADAAGNTEQMGNGRVNVARALSETASEPIQPTGASGDSGISSGRHAAVVETDLPLRADLVVPIPGGSTTKTVASSYGSVMFLDHFIGPGGINFDFYSPVLTAPQVLAPTDSAAANLWARNTGPNTLSFSPSARFYDYDPSTGAQVQFIATAGGTQGMVAGSPDRPFAISFGGIPGGAGYTIPAGHQLKVTITLAVTQGTAGALMYNAPDGMHGDSIIRFVNTVAKPWPFGSYNASKLALSVNGGNDVVSGTPFDVVVNALDTNGNSGTVVANTTVSLAVQNGAGTLGGTTTGMIPAGSSQVTISGVTYTKTGGEASVVLRASTTSGDALTSASSAPFNVSGLAPVIDLSLAKSHIGNFTEGTNGLYSLVVTNTGNTATAGTITVTDTLPAGLGFVSGTGTSWSCSAAVQTVTCTNPGPIPGNNGNSTISLSVSVSAAAVPSVTNQASVSTPGDINAANDSASDSTTVSAISRPDLAMLKGHVGDFTVGAQGNYYLSVTNVGTAATTGMITLSDTLPTGLGFVSGIETGWSCLALGQVVTCTSTDPLLPGQHSLVLLTVTVDAAAAPGVTNTANVSTAGDVNVANDSSSDPTTVRAPVIDLGLTKSQSGTFTVGSNGNYILSVTNIGTGPTTGTITVVDTLPAGLGFVSGTGNGWNCSATGQTVTCTNPGPINVPAGNSFFTLNVSVGAAAAPSVTNTATVSTPGDANANNNSSSATVTVNPAPVIDLALRKSQNGTFTVGSNGSYTLSVTNVGTGPTTGTITVVDTLPAGLGAVSATGNGWTCSAAGQTVTCSNPGPITVPAGNSFFTLTVSVGAAAAPSVTNTATVSTAGDTNTNNDTSSATVTVNPAPVIDLALRKSQNGTFTVGSNGSYTLSVTNVGTGPTTGTITVVDTLPAGLGAVSVTGNGWTCSAAGQTVTCSNPGPITVPAGNSFFTLTVSVGAAAAPSVTNTATVSTPGDTNSSNNSSSVRTAVNILDLSLTKTHIGNFTVGSNGVYSLAVRNVGTLATTGAISVSDTLPNGLGFVSGTGANWTCSAVVQTVSCINSAPLAPGAVSTIALTVSVAAAAVPGVTNTATVSTTGDANPNNNSSSNPTTVNPTADLSVNQTASPNPVNVGGTLTYTMVVRNGGPFTATGVTLTDTLMDTFVSASSSQGTCTVGKVRGNLVLNCALGTLNNGTSATVTLLVKVPKKKGTTSNTASVIANEADPNPANNSATASATIQ